MHWVLGSEMTISMIKYFTAQFFGYKDFCSNEPIPLCLTNSLMESKILDYLCFGNACFSSSIKILTDFKITQSSDASVISHLWPPAGKSKAAFLGLHWIYILHCRALRSNGKGGRDSQLGRVEYPHLSNFARIKKITLTLPLSDKINCSNQWGEVLQKKVCKQLKLVEPDKARVSW